MKNSALLVALCALSLPGSGSLLAQITNQDRMPPAAIHTGGPSAAQAALDVWLGLVDDGQYAKAWESASGMFRKAVLQEQWTTLAQKHRTPLGKLLSRKVTSAIFTTTLPGAPNGQYVVVEYISSFEHKQSAHETATAMLDVDGLWKLTGYFVR